MEFSISTEKYLDYIVMCMERLNKQRSYITELDSKLGDGDHWVNLYSGFESVIKSSEDIINMSISDAVRRIGEIFMGNIGGSSGLLYGSAYVSASKAIKESDSINSRNLGDFLIAMRDDMSLRGKVKFGDKTMFDPLYLAIDSYTDSLEAGGSFLNAINRLKDGAIEGMNRTVDMEAKKGRGRYHNTKGVGIIDPGAVTMSILLASLADYVKRIMIEKKEEEKR